MSETLISQIPALQLLTALGYRYLTPTEALALRDQRYMAGDIFHLMVERGLSSE